MYQAGFNLRSRGDCHRFVGGYAGAYIENALKPFGIKSAFYHVAAESRSCINIWDEVNKVQTEFLEPGFTLTEEDFAGI